MPRHHAFTDFTGSTGSTGSTGFMASPGSTASRVSRPACLCGAAALAALLLGGCYERVVSAPETTRGNTEVYAPSRDTQGPSIMNQIMWGDPPKGEDPVAYYRRKNSLGLQQ